MGHHDEGCRGCPATSGQQIEYLSAGVRIKVARRLIRQNNQRVFNQRPCDSDPLLFPAGKFMGKSFSLSLKSDFLEGIDDPCPGFPSPAIPVK